jgi:hypothetical protein
MTDKSAIHNLIFGTHYRKIYGTLIDSKTASLDTLYGGLTHRELVAAIKLSHYD